MSRSGHRAPRGLLLIGRFGNEHLAEFRLAVQGPRLCHVALLVAGRGACAPREGPGARRPPGATPATATSAADFGGHGRARRGGQEGRPTQRHRAAAGLGQLRRDHQGLRATSTASRSTRPSPTRPARTRSTPPTSRRASSSAPDVFDLGSPSRWPTPRCSPRTRSRRSPTSRTRSRTPTAPGSTTTAATCRSATTPPRCRRSPASTTCSSPSTRARSRSTATRPRPARRSPAW